MRLFGDGREHRDFAVASELAYARPVIVRLAMGR
jgi:hypothetical protein